MSKGHALPSTSDGKTTMSMNTETNRLLDTQQERLNGNVIAGSLTSPRSRPWDSKQAKAETESTKTDTIVHGTGRDDDTADDRTVLTPKLDSMSTPPYLRSIDPIDHFFTIPCPGESMTNDFHVFQMTTAKSRRDTASRSATSGHGVSQVGRHLLEVEWNGQEKSTVKGSQIYTLGSQAVTSEGQNSDDRSLVPTVPDMDADENQANSSVSSDVDESNRLVQHPSITPNDPESSSTSAVVSLPSTNQRGSSARPAVETEERKPYHWITEDGDLKTGRSKPIANYRLHLIKLFPETKDQDDGETYWGLRRDEAYHWSYTMATLLFVFILALPIFLYYFFTSRGLERMRR